MYMERYQVIGSGGLKVGKEANMGGMKMEMKPTSMRLPTDVKERLEKAASSQRRSVSNLILIAIEEYLDRNPIETKRKR